MTRRTLGILGAAAVLALAAPFLSRADIASSTHFLVEDSYVGFFSGSSSSTDFQVLSGATPFVNGNASSASFLDHAGPENYADFAPRSYAWRWYSDAADEKPVSPLAAENVAPSNIASNQAIKLRIDIRETGGVGADNVKYALQYSTYSDFSAAVSAVTDIGSCVASSTWCYASVAGGGTDNAVVSSTVLSTSGPCAAGSGTGCGTHNTSGTSTSTFTQAASSTAEFEFTVQGIAPSAGTTYFFRPVYADTGVPAPLYATSSYPSLLTAGAALTFSVSGLPQGTSTNGVVTGVSTTATSISFGTLVIATSVAGAQRLSITTNAGNGYEIYAYQDSPLTDGQGHSIPGVAGTNVSPLPWTSACLATSTACYGYHPGSPVLAGGSTRFAANDTYAALTSTPAEIGYGSVPVSSSTVDVVYRIQAGATQVNGSYGDNVVYVATPSY
ncbi:MAG TPA: hypothetical protein VMT99_02565 [Candidatus Paceibacterota bacterium]|nr:hypothetical protein [Candidatus Paceibacterota bacterium]